MATTMLYMKDNYIKNFDAKVISVGDDYVVLDQSAFYPLGGGQESDQGVLKFNQKNIIIKEVRRDSGEIKHFLEKPELLPKIGDTVNCELDWNRRHIHMRYHTALHILSRFMQLEFNAEVVGNNISTRNGRADFNLTTALTNDELQKIEKGVNDIVKKKLPVELNFMPRAEAITYLKEKGYQTDYIDMVPPSVKTFRIISVGEYDFASCAGTHVANTSEIGEIKVVKRRSLGVGKERITLTLASEL